MEKQPSKQLLSRSNFLQFFTAVYFFLYIFPFPLNYIPFVGKIFNWYYQTIEILTLWTGKTILGLESLEKIQFTGSGDTTFDYVKIFTLLILSLCVTLLVFFLRIRLNTGKIIVFVRTYGRYFLVLMLLSYGFSKFFEGQFSYPSLERLDRKIGDSSPMGLLWTFMGYSKIYTVFGGFCQVLAGCLLIFRRTMIIGSLLALMVMTNIVVLNFSYDVPVKLFSTHLAVIALLLLIPNVVNLFQLFFMQKSVQLIPERSLFKNKNKQLVAILLKLMAISGLQLIVIIMTVRSFFDTPLNGHNLKAIYYPEQFTIESTSVNRWQKFIINDRYATVFYDEKRYEDFDVKVDTLKHIIQLKSKKDTLNISTLDYRFSDKNTKMYLTGIFQKDTVSITFNIKRKEDFELVDRKFNWINEYPYNK